MRGEPDETWIDKAMRSVAPTLSHDLDAMPVADELLKQGHLLAPGDLFSGAKRARSKMRFNVSRTLYSPALPALARALETRMGKA